MWLVVQAHFVMLMMSACRRTSSHPLITTCDEVVLRYSSWAAD